MQNKYFKNFVNTLLIISFLVMPFYGIPKKAQAQSLGAYVTGLAPAITKLPLCKGKLWSATKTLFAGEFSAALGKLTEKVEAKINKAKNALKQEQEEAAAQFNAIGTYDAETNKKLRVLGANLNEVKASTASLDVNDTCLNSIGRIVIKMLLQKMTMSTVNWINSGFDGKPAFIQDPSKFFGDIAKNEFLQFGGEINDPKLFPFGKAWIRNQATHFNNKFADNARYSLDELIRNTTPQYSATGFWLNFDQGGWGAWSAMTQYPQNNALGFQLMASNELQRRLAGTAQSTAQNVRDALQAADGFLGDQRCVDPSGVTREAHNSALAGTGKGPKPQLDDPIYATSTSSQFGNVDMTSYQADLTAWENTPEPRVCNRWEYVTPGKLIAEAATSTIKYPENNLLKADDLNDAMTAIMDALLARFSNDLMQKGYANLGNDGSDGLFAYAQGSLGGDNTTQTEKDFRPIQLASSWLANNPNFNIRTDLTQALIDEQRTYIDKLEMQNKELYSTTNNQDYAMGAGGTSNAYGLIPIINQLDYCIPGPHPGWENDSRRVLDAVANTIIPETRDSVKNLGREQILAAAKGIAPVAGSAAGAAIAITLAGGAAAAGSVVPVVGTVIGAVAGLIVGGLIGWLAKPNTGDMIRQYYDAIITGFTGIQNNWDDGKDPNAHNLDNKQGAVQSLNTIFDRYADIINLVYNEKVLPSMYRESNAEVNKRQGYVQIIENNKEKISVIKNVVTILNQIKTSVDELNTTYSREGEEYESQLQTQIDAFGRVSANMVNGDDIAEADNLLKQIVDAEEYVYNDLLKGEFGCEKELEGGIAGQIDKLPEQLYKTKRMEYPFPILYTYDMGAGLLIPDLAGYPRYENKTNKKASNEFGPGFLSYYFFQSVETGHSACVADQNGAVAKCELQIDDLLPMFGGTKTAPQRRLGSVQPRPSGTPFQDITDPTSGPFEYTIGAY